MKKRTSSFLLLIVICCFAAMALATTPNSIDFSFTLQNDAPVDIVELEHSRTQETWSRLKLFTEPLESGTKSDISLIIMGGSSVHIINYIRITDRNGDSWIFSDVELNEVESTVTNILVFSFDENGEARLE